MNEHITERRTQPRHRVLKGGRLAFHGGGGIDCVVRNISSTGARLDVPTALGLPQSFTLSIAADHFTRRCHPVWSRNKQVGVAFD